MDQNMKNTWLKKLDMHFKRIQVHNNHPEQKNDEVSIEI